MNKINEIPSMTPSVVLEYLEEVGRSWSGSGVAVELGSWLGATATSLLKGLVEAGYDRNFYAFDFWKANDEQIEKAKIQGLNLHVKQDLRPLFLENVETVYSKVITYQGRLPRTLEHYSEHPIEICLFDAPKRDPVFSDCMNGLVPYFIPGITIVGLMDYYFYKSKDDVVREWVKAPVSYIKEYSENFEKIKEWRGEVECVFFKYIKKIGG